MENENKNVQQNGNVGGGNHHKKRRRNRHKKRPQEGAVQAGQQPQQAAQNGQKQPQKQPQKPQQQQQPQKENKNNRLKDGREKEKNRNGNDRGERVEKADKNENRKDTYAYILDGNLYLNLTNKCSNGCDFCVRNERSSYYGNYLWLRHGEPTTEKVIAALNGMGDLKRFKEAVFCGFGEPTYRLKEMLELCDYFHEKGIKTRLNTNGQANLIHKRDIVPELKGKIDAVNVSLNASCAEKYQKICRSMFGENGFAALVEFARSCKREGVNCRFSIVDCIGEEEVEACKALSSSVGVPLYIRKYITDS